MRKEMHEAIERDRQQAAAQNGREFAERLWDAGYAAWYEHAPGTYDRENAIAAIERLLESKGK